MFVVAFLTPSFHREHGIAPKCIAAEYSVLRRHSTLCNSRACYYPQLKDRDRVSFIAEHKVRLSGMTGMFDPVRAVAPNSGATTTGELCGMRPESLRWFRHATSSFVRCAYRRHRQDPMFFIATHRRLAARLGGSSSKSRIRFQGLDHCNDQRQNARPHPARDSIRERYRTTVACPTAFAHLGQDISLLDALHAFGFLSHPRSRRAYCG